ncbi:Fic family protein [Acetobacterium sp.]|uniref:Fic family protein n=1 Tax=Acetobacterium sp. TaxID=1872094 RepID=UPI0035943900
MEAEKFIAMLSDKHLIDLKKMQHKYSPNEVAEMIALLRKDFFKTLPLRDFDGQSLVYLENRVRLSMASARVLFARPPGTHPYNINAMTTEIQATLAIENITSSRESIRHILTGYAPQDESEQRLWGMKKGLDFISNPANKITEATLYQLYMMTVGDFLEPENQLELGRFYRDDAVYIVGEKIEHAGLPAHQLPAAMAQLVDFINSEDQLNDLLKAVIVHFYLAYLHPYFDGNGRMARMLHLWLLIQQGYPAALFQPLSDHINATRKDYYQAFSRVEDNHRISGIVDVTPFLVYFIEAVYHQLKPQTGVAADGLAVYQEALAAGLITAKEKALFEFVLAAYGRAEFSTKQLEKDFGAAAYATIRGFVLKFAELGLLGVHKYGNRNKYFVR